MKTIKLDGRSLTLEALAPVASGARGEALRLSVDRGALDAVRKARQMVDDKVEAGEVIYGLTTGFGKLKNVAIAAKDLKTLQKNLILSHCCGIGEPLAVAEVRLAQVLRLNGLLRGHSGVRTQTVQKLVRLFNAGFVPVVPSQGSVGASGDLAPLAHMAAAYMGHGEAVLLSDPPGRVRAAKAALKAVGEEALTLGAKEGLALINGTETMNAVGVRVLLRAENLSRSSDAIASLSLEALMGSIRPFDGRLAELKGVDTNESMDSREGHRRTAANVRACLADSKIIKSHADCDRVQDPYSLRCVPQVHGAFKTALAHVRAVLAGEINAVTDNPLLFPDTDEVINAGQFHGQPISMVMDYLGLALCTLANISERRVEQLVNPDLSGLPAFLTTEPGLNSGLMIAQVAAASLASENKVFAHPASVDTIPTSGGQEDHVSMGMIAARKARSILENTENILAIEWLCAAQGLELRGDLDPGRGANAIRVRLREDVRPLKGDRYLHRDIKMACDLLRTGELVRAAEAAVGPLAP